MSYDLTKIEYFQFNNLVLNRIPFLLLHDGLAFSELFGPVEKMHLDRWGQQIDFSSSVAAMEEAITERSVPKTMPIVLLSKGSESLEDWILRLEKAGYPNVCWVAGGWNSLKEESTRV